MNTCINYNSIVVKEYILLKTLPNSFYNSYILLFLSLVNIDYLYSIYFSHISHILYFLCFFMFLYLLCFLYFLCFFIFMFFNILSVSIFLND